MRISLFLVCLLFIVPSAFSQTGEVNIKPRKHKFYVYWGWNRGWFSRSDIHFHGRGYDFKLDKVVAHDRQNKLGFDPYLNVGDMTIPQTNMKVGYFLNEHWSVVAGFDHMKYVMDADQIVNMTGTITNSGTPYDGVYNNSRMQLKEDFLKFEHTNGLNYIHVGIRRHDTFAQLAKFHLPNITVNVIEGFEAGVLYPRTNTTLLAYKRYDEFHVAGYAFSAMAGVNVTFFEHFFIQSEWKTGLCMMPDIRTTEFAEDRADQHFIFNQFNIVLGANINIGRRGNGR